jgi:hypothetical protein
MRKVSRRTKAVLAAAGAVAVAVNGGVAWAFWQTSGAATASATAGTVVAVQATGTPMSNAPLYPGVQRNIKVTVKNQNTFAVQVTHVRRSTAPTVVDAAHATAGCVHSGVLLTNDIYSVAWTVGPNATAAFTVPGGLKMTNESDSACQGATFTVPIIVIGQAKP